MGEEQPGQVANLPRGQEIMPHEPLDRRHAVAVRIAQAAGQFALHVEGQPLIGAPDHVVQVDAHRPQEILCALELPQLGGGQQPLVDQLGNTLDLIGVFPDPEERVEIAQAALALFEIGFDDIAAVAHALVPRLALGELLGDEHLGSAAHHIAAEARPGLGIKRLVTPDVARFEQRGADGQIFLRHPDHLVERAARLPDLQPEVPEDVEHRFDDLLAPRRLLPWGQEGDVDVRKRRHLAAPVAADRHQRQPFRRRRVDRRIHRGGHEIIGEAQQLIGQERIFGGMFAAPARVRGDAALDLGAGILERLAEDGYRPFAALARVGAMGSHLAQRIGDGAPVENGAAVGNGVEAGGHGC